MIKIITATPKPITFIGKCATICTNTTEENKHYNIGINCLDSNHGRVLEYPDIVVEINNYSARMCRELYTHIIGVTRLQESTRYVSSEYFGYYVPDSLQNNSEAFKIYHSTMKNIQESYKELIKQGVPKEDVANLLPLGMNTKVLLKINLRAIIHLFHERSCFKAYKEIRKFMTELQYELGKIDSEWNYLCNNYFRPKCELNRICLEKKSCGKYKEKTKTNATDI